MKPSFVKWAINWLFYLLSTSKLNLSTYKTHYFNTCFFTPTIYKFPFLRLINQDYLSPENHIIMQNNYIDNESIDNLGSGTRGSYGFRGRGSGRRSSQPRGSHAMSRQGYDRYAVPENNGMFSSTGEYSRYYSRVIQEEVYANKQANKEAALDNVTMHWHPRERGSVIVVDAPDTLNRRLYGKRAHIFLNISKEYSEKGVRGVIINVTDKLPLKIFVFSFKRVFSSTHTVKGKLSLIPMSGFKAAEQAVMLENLNSIPQVISTQILKNSPVVPSDKRPIEDIHSITGTSDLNEIQSQTLKNVFRSSLSLIQGPPGTGKTTLAASIIYNMFHETKAPILVCAPSNSAVDNLTEKLMNTGLNLVRVVSYTGYGRLPNLIKRVTLLQKVLTNPAVGPNFIYQAKLLLHTNHHLEAEEMMDYNDKLDNYQNDVLAEADVVLCTCTMTNRDIIKNIASKFQFALIDESTQAIEPDCLLPFELNSGHVALLGDHMQLGPIVKSSKLKESTFAKSLFERLVDNGFKPFLLGIQYRMHPKLYELPNSLFYDNSVESSVTAEQRTQNVSFCWPASDYPMMLWHCDQEETIDIDTYYNIREARRCKVLIDMLLESGVSATQIAVITPYAGQRSYIRNVVFDHDASHATVDVEILEDFQGRERDYIIFTCVRSNSDRRIGFLANEKRLNVAITRARCGLFILANVDMFKYVAYWDPLVRFFREKGCLVSGPFDNLVIDVPVPVSGSSKC